LLGPDHLLRGRSRTYDMKFSLSVRFLKVLKHLPFDFHDLPHFFIRQSPVLLAQFDYLL
jgi:hypothetical protein